jgi:DNA-binding protein HU-beta
MIGAISSSLAKGNKVQLAGFGSFAVRRRAARKGRNPQNGKEFPAKFRFLRLEKR